MAMNSTDKTFPTKEIKAVHDRRGNLNFRPCVIIVIFFRLLYLSIQLLSCKSV